VRRDQAKQGKVWEFTARDCVTGVEIAIEANSRHRPGALGFRGDADAEKAARGDVDRLVNEALGQDPGTMPFMIFVEVNMPPAPGVPFEQRQWGRDINEMMQSIPPPTAEKPEAFNALVVTNFSGHWAGDQAAPGTEYLQIVPKYARHPVSGDVIGRVLAAVATCGKVPNEV